MTSFNCFCRKDCTLGAIIASLIIGVVAAFLQITAVITVTPTILWVALGGAAVYLAVLLLTTALDRRTECSPCLCRALSTALAGILGTLLLAAVLLVAGIVATSILSAILVGLLAASLTLTLAGTACLVSCLAGCNS